VDVVEGELVVDEDDSEEVLLALVLDEAVERLEISVEDCD
jgi:hypothetical protein